MSLTYGHYHGKCMLLSDLMNNQTWSRSFKRDTFTKIEIYSQILFSVRSQSPLFGTNGLSPYLAVEEENGSISICRRYLPGISLAAHLETNGRIIDGLIHHMLSLASSLLQLHSQGIVAQNIKPSNIIISNSGEMVFTDFGISALTDDTFHTQTIWAVLLPGPECVLRGIPEFTKESDVFQLGMVFYAMATGTLPWTALNLTSIYHQLLTGIPFNSFDSYQIAPGLSELIKSMVSPNPLDRPKLEMIISELTCLAPTPDESFIAQKMTRSRLQRNNVSKSRSLKMSKILAGNKTPAEFQAVPRHRIAPARSDDQCRSVNLTGAQATFLDPDE